MLCDTATLSISQLSLKPDEEEIKKERLVAILEMRLYENCTLWLAGAIDLFIDW